MGLKKDVFVEYIKELKDRNQEMESALAHHSKLTKKHLDRVDELKEEIDELRGEINKLRGGSDRKLVVDMPAKKLKEILCDRYGVNHHSNWWDLTNRLVIEMCDED